MPFYKNIHSLQYKLVDLIQLLTIIFYISISLQLSAFAPQYLSYLQFFLKIYVSLFLIYRFNDFRTVKFTDLDRKIGFNAGIILIGSDIVNYLAKKYSNEIRNFNSFIAIFFKKYISFFRN